MFAKSAKCHIVFKAPFACLICGLLSSLPAIKCQIKQVLWSLQPVSVNSGGRFG